MDTLNVEQWKLLILGVMLTGVIYIAAVLTWGLRAPRKATGAGRDWGRIIRRLRREKAIVRQLVAQAVALAAILGIEPSPEVIIAIEGIAVTAGTLWTRMGVTPSDDPADEVIERALEARS